MSVSAAASSGYTDPNQFVPVLPSENAVTARAAKGQDSQDSKHPTLFQDGDDSPSFWDLLDVINPLQHIPVINTLYQELTGDKIGVGAKLAGDALFGGPIGLIASAVNCIVEEETGDDIGGHVLALFKGDSADVSTQIADNGPAEVQDQTASAAKAPPPTIPPVPVADAQSPDSQTPTVPVVALGESTATASVNTASAAPMMFGADGLIVGNATATAASEIAAATQTASVASTGKFMPVPSRGAARADRAPPPISVPISSNGTRSNVPITGYNPANYRVPDAATVQKAMAAQGLPANTQHAMLPNAEMPPAAGSPDWFQSMNQALDKYQKAGNLASRAESSSASTLQ